MARIMVPKVSGLALVHYSQEPFKWHEIINEEKKIPSNCIMQNKKKFESMIYSRKKQPSQLVCHYNFLRIQSYKILFRISLYPILYKYLLPYPTNTQYPSKEKKTWRSIYNSFFYFILTMKIEIVVEECKKISQNNNK